MQDRNEKRTITARELDGRLKELMRSARRAEAEVAAALFELKRRGLFRVLGYARIQDYAEVELDMPRAKAKALVEVAKRLVALPAVRRTFEEGRICWTKARLVVRVATPDSEEHWLHEAEVLSVRGLESAVARERGDAPVVRVTLELTPEEAADLDEAVRKLREERGVAVPVGSAVAELCRRAQGPPVDRPGFQVVIQECARCATATRDTRDGPIVVAPEEVAAAKVDAEVLDLREGGPGRRHLSIAPAERRAVIARDHGRCALCGTRSWLHIHHLERNKGDVRALSLLCSACHKGLVHAGHVAIDGHAPSLAFRLRDGTPAPVRSR